MRTVKTIGIFGDSSGWTGNGTSVGGWSDNNTPWVGQHWSHQMVQQLDAQKPNVKLRLVNHSYGGQSSNDLYRRIGGWSRFPMDGAILDVGTNDCANNANPPATTVANLTSVIKRLRAWHGPSLPVVICVPWNEAEATRAPYLAAMQAAIAGIAATVGGNTATADWRNAWTVAGSGPNLSPDGLHPNSAGHALLSPITVTALLTAAPWMFG